MSDRLGYTARQLAAALDDLAPAERRAAQVLIDRADDVGELSVTDVATAAGTSEATVVRMCKKAGFGGFNDVKLRLHRDFGTAMDVGGEVDAGDRTRVVVRKVFAAASASLAETAGLLEPRLLSRVVTAVERARSVMLFGVGTSAYVALDAGRRLMRAGVQVGVETSGVDQAVRAALLGRDDVVLAVSSSGRSRDVLEGVQVAAGRGATTIAVTHAPRSPLAELADIVVPVAAQESAYGTEAMAARLTMLAALDAVFVLLALRRNEITLTNLERVESALAPKRSGR